MTGHIACIMCSVCNGTMKLKSMVLSYMNQPQDKYYTSTNMFEILRLIPSVIGMAFAKSGGKKIRSG